MRAVLIKQRGDQTFDGALEGGAEEQLLELRLVGAVALFENMQKGGAEQSVLVFEAAIDRRGRDTCLGGHARDGAGFKAVLVQSPDRRGQEQPEGLATAFL